VVRTGQAAIDFAEERVGEQMPAAGYCLQFTRENFAVPALYGSAIDAWNATRYPHPDDRTPPWAVPVYFWSDNPYRHVAFHCKDGRVISTYNADIRAYSSISAMEQHFGPYLGWSEDLNGVTVYTHKEEDDDMTDAEYKALRDELDWIHKRLGGSTSHDSLTDRFTEQDAVIGWLKDRLGGSTSWTDFTTALQEGGKSLDWLHDRLGGSTSWPDITERLNEIEAKIDALEAKGRET
jgi:hypothetical protein